MRTVNMKGESVVKGGKCTTEKMSPRPRTVTAIVLSLRKTPIGLVYKPTYVFLFPLASSVLYLLSNLVSSLGLPV